MSNKRKYSDFLPDKRRALDAECEGQETDRSKAETIQKASDSAEIVHKDLKVLEDSQERVRDFEPALGAGAAGATKMGFTRHESEVLAKDIGKRIQEESYKMCKTEVHTKDSAGAQNEGDASLTSLSALYEYGGSQEKTAAMLTRWHCDVCNIYFFSAQALGGHKGNSIDHKRQLEKLKRGDVASLPDTPRLSLN
eukprot:2151452-Rhodomonas_salina.1